MDVVVELRPGGSYSPGFIGLTGIESKFEQYGQINMDSDVSTPLELTFIMVDHETNLEMTPIEVLKWTFLDFDMKYWDCTKNNNAAKKCKKAGVTHNAIKVNEVLRIKQSEYEEFYTSATKEGTSNGLDTGTSKVVVTQPVIDGVEYLEVRAEVEDIPNPAHPLAMNQEQQKVAIGFYFKDRARFDVDLIIEGGYGGTRNLFFTGASLQTEQGTCLPVVETEATIEDNPDSSDTTTDVAPPEDGRE